MSTKRTIELTPDQAKWVLSRMLDDRRLTRRELDGYLKRMTNEIAELEQEIARLRSAIPGGPHGFPAVKASRASRARRNVSPEVLASRRLQGEYIRAIKALPERERPKYKRIARQEGREAAIAAMAKSAASTKRKRAKRRPARRK